MAAVATVRGTITSAFARSIMRDLLAGHGFAVARDDDLLAIAEGLRTPVRTPGRCGSAT